jgi:purine-binding chemotaxis protein CheW
MKMISENRDRDNQEILKEIGRLAREIDLLKRKVGSVQDVQKLPTGKVKLMTCSIGNEKVAFLLDHVVSVYMSAKLSTIPETPDWIAGMLNLHGDMVPVLNSLTRIYGQQHEPNENDFIIICSIQERRVGIIVQQVHEVIDADIDALQKPDPHIPQAPYLLGVVQNAKGPLLLVNIDNLIMASDIPN